MPRDGAFLPAGGLAAGTGSDMCTTTRGPVAAGLHATVEELETAGGPRELRVVVSVPFQLQSMADADLSIAAASLCLRGPAETGGQEVTIDLPAGFLLDPDLASAKYSRKKQQLVITSPSKVVQPVPPRPGSPASAPEPVAQAAAAAVAAAAGEVSRGGYPTSPASPPAPAVERTAPERAPQPSQVTGYSSSWDADVAGYRAPAPEEEDDDDDDLPPPLEATRTVAAPTPSAAAPLVANTAAAVALDAGGKEPEQEAAEETNAAAELMMQQAVAAREAKQKKTEESRRNADLAKSGGLKKGFLSGGKSSKSSGSASAKKAAAASNGSAQRSKAADDDIPFIKGSADPEAARRESLKLPEVQKAIRQNTEALKKDQSWVTPELMKALQSKPELLKGLSNPIVQEAISLMQSDPEAAQRKYSSNPEVSGFLHEFSGLMATHFDLLGKDEKAKPKAPPSAAAAPSISTMEAAWALEDSIGGSPATPAPLYTGNLPADDPVTKALSDPKVSEAFQDPEVQQLLAELRAGRPLEMRELCRERPQLFGKVKALLDAGLLNLQT